MLFASQMLDVHLRGFYSLLQEAFSGLSHLPGLGALPLCSPGSQMLLCTKCSGLSRMSDCELPEGGNWV